MICPFCKKPAKFVDNKEVYGKRYGKSYMMYWCQSCDARVGTHQNDPKRPLGTMANAELRAWRTRAHASVDPLWKYGEMPRDKVYNMLSCKFERDIHIGEADIKTCQDIITFIAIRRHELKTIK